MPLPELTHLQFAVLHCLMGGAQCGRTIREKLNKVMCFKTVPAFYQLMDQLENSKFVNGWYKNNVIDGNTFKERLYQATEKGLSVYNNTVLFYQSRIH